MVETSRNPAHKILAIEDDPDVLALYKSYLQKRGYEVLTASGAVEGMSLLQSHPDTRLILLDLNLPGMSGEEWIAWYVAQGKQTPVVVASGKGDILTITKGNNMTAALTKPFHMEELQELIEVLLADDWHDHLEGRKDQAHLQTVPFRQTLETKCRRDRERIHAAAVGAPSDVDDRDPASR